MKNNKGFGLLALLLIVVGVLVVGGGAYYFGTKNSLPLISLKDTVGDSTRFQVDNNFKKESCLIITFPIPNQTISFPLNVEGYIDLVGAKADTCTKWGSFEGTAGEVVVKDINGNVKSLSYKIDTIGDYFTGMEKWPIKASIQNLTGVPSTNEIAIHATTTIGENPIISVTKIIQPLFTTSYLNNL